MTQAVAAAPPIDPQQLRACLGSFVTGVTVMTTTGADGRYYGLTANSFSSVSLEPPLILWSQRLAAGSYPIFRDATRFAVNILAEDQVETAKCFAKAAEDKFTGVGIQPGLHGVPLIEGCAAYLECCKEATYPGGDHAVFLGRVERIQTSGRKPLAFGTGKFMVIHPHDLGAFSVDLGLANPARVNAVKIATPVLEELGSRLDKTVGLAVWGNCGPTMIHWEEATTPLAVRLRTGLVLPLLTSATGLAFATYLPRSITGSFIEAELGAAMGSSQPEGPSTPLEFDASIADVRAHGMARIVANVVPDVNEIGVNAFSAPVFDQDGVIVFAITVMGHADSFACDWDDPVVAVLRETTARLSRRLGFRG